MLNLKIDHCIEQNQQLIRGRRNIKNRMQINCIFVYSRKSKKYGILEVLTTPKKYSLSEIRPNNIM